MRDRKTDHQVLRFHTQWPPGTHGQYQIDGFAFRRIQDDFGIAEDESVWADGPLPRCFIEFRASPQCVPDPGRLRIEADIPRETDVRRLDQRLDLHFGADEMRDPFRNDLAERVEPAPTRGEIERH